MDVITIGEYAFRECTSFTSLTLNENLLAINDYAFYKCEGLAGNLIIPDQVQTIGEYVFYNCIGYTGNNLVIGKSVTSIEYKAFYNSSGIYFSKVYFKGVEPPNMRDYNRGDRFNQSLPYVGVPFGSKEKYKEAFGNSYPPKILEEVAF